MAFEQGPYVKAAFFCDLMIRGDDGVLTPVRMVDRLTQRAVGQDPPDDMPPLTWNGTLHVALTAGRAQGRAQVRISIEKPSGERSELARQDVQFGSDHTAVGIVAPSKITFGSEGVYWFHVLVDSKEITRMPLEVVYERTIGATPGPQR